MVIPGFMLYVSFLKTELNINITAIKVKHNFSILAIPQGDWNY